MIEGEPEDIEPSVSERRWFERYIDSAHIAKSFLTLEEIQAIEQYIEIVGELTDIPEVDRKIMEDALDRVPGAREAQAKWHNIMQRIRHGGSDE